MDREYSNGAFIAGAADFPLRWQAQAAAFRERLGDRALLDRAYGRAARHRFDLFLPDGKPKGTLVFVHGGYWMAFGRESWSHLAAGAVARGWACAMPSYDLAPNARISTMTQNIAAAVNTVAAMIVGPIVVAGHSAGGHLSARMGCVGVPVAAQVVRIVPISPLAELSPLLAAQMNETLGLDMAEVAAESPARCDLRGGVQVHIWVGGQERPAFLWQARTLSEAWNCPWTVAEGRHHFDVIDDLADPLSALMETLLGGL